MGSGRQAARGLRRDKQSDNFDRLAKHSTRQERVCTPGPYDCRRAPYEDRRIPMTIGGDSKGARSGFDPNAHRGDAPETTGPINYAAIEGKPFAATFSLEPRFGWSTVLKEKRIKDAGGAAGTRVTEASYAAVEPKSFAVSFNLASSQSAFPKDPLLLRGTLGPAPGKYASQHNTIDEFVRKNHGGVISSEPRPMNWAVHSDSPGPIYNPNYGAVEPVDKGVMFSTNPRLPGVKEKTTPGPFRYADGALKALDILSTNKRVPNPVFSSCPGASEMPYPYDKANFFNSGTMRTKMRGPAFEESRKENDDLEKRKMRFWRRRAQSSASSRPRSAPGSALGVVGNASRPGSAAGTLHTLQSNPLKAIMRIAERGYEISSIMRAIYERELAASGDASGSGGEAAAAAAAPDGTIPEGIDDIDDGGHIPNGRPAAADMLLPRKGLGGGGGSATASVSGASDFDSATQADASILATPSEGKALPGDERDRGQGRGRGSKRMREL